MGSDEAMRRRRLRSRIGRATLVVVVLFAVLSVFAFRWATRSASWPSELDQPRTSALFSDIEEPSVEDLARLGDLVTDIAVSDPVVIGLLGVSPWPEPVIEPVYWVHDGQQARRVLIGGSFRLTLDGSSYQGPWPQAGCKKGHARGTVRSANAVGLRDVVVTVDLTFERVTHLSIPPTRAPATPSVVPPEIDYAEDLPDAPWYTSTCPWVSFS